MVYKISNNLLLSLTKFSHVFLLKKKEHNMIMLPFGCLKNVYFTSS